MASCQNFPGICSTFRDSFKIRSWMLQEKLLRSLSRYTYVHISWQRRALRARPRVMRRPGHRPDRQTSRTTGPKMGKGDPKRAPTYLRAPSRRTGNGMPLRRCHAVVCVSSRADSSSEHKGSQPHITRGRAEALSPGLLVLSSPGGQKALEPLCQPRRGRGIRKHVAVPKTHKKKKQEKRERERGETHRASGQPKPKTQEEPHNGRTRTLKRQAQSAGRKNARQILVGRGITPQRFERKTAPKNKRKTTFSLRGQRTNRVLWGNLSLILS